MKLADVLQKLIIPVSFVDHWPPKCLAIQFATTQYIPWESKDGAIPEGTYVTCAVLSLPCVKQWVYIYITMRHVEVKV